MVIDPGLFSPSMTFLTFSAAGCRLYQTDSIFTLAIEALAKIYVVKLISLQYCRIINLCCCCCCWCWCWCCRCRCCCWIFIHFCSEFCTIYASCDAIYHTSGKLQIFGKHCGFVLDFRDIFSIFPLRRRQCNSPDFRKSFRVSETWGPWNHVETLRKMVNIVQKTVCSCMLHFVQVVM